MSTTAIATLLSLRGQPCLTYNKFFKTGLVECQPRGGTTRTKLNNDQKEMIIKWTDENCILSLKELNEKVFLEYNVNVSISTINRCLKNVHYTLIKSLVAVPVRRNCISTLQKRFEYATNFRILEASTPHYHMIFLDEVGFMIVTRPNKGRSLIGEMGKYLKYV
ncbi:hypothetical protein A3Q56_04244 [Intoshia linei]|uniref:Transposase Tc1-like domain-containing protein n=1 Tax=Intoshia linei TaxID=1819745 RepID=A0A177B1D6_9BILA|nr:hypothetical protein A3Q56_04244 [Intoshia linei]